MVQKWPPVLYWAPLNGTCDQHNATEARCFGRGECAFNRIAGYHACKCITFYDPLTLCEHTIFDVLQGGDLPYIIVRPSEYFRFFTGSGRLVFSLLI